MNMDWDKLRNSDAAIQAEAAKQLTGVIAAKGIDSIPVGKEPDQVDSVLLQRGAQYGEFGTHAEITQRLMLVLSDYKGWNALPFYMKEAIHMIFHKIGRIINGNPYLADSWIDISGYSKLVNDIIVKITAGRNDKF